MLLLLRFGKEFAQSRSNIRMKIDGKVVLITGASQGIGAACARELRSRGARLSLTARSEDKLKEVADADAVVTAGDLMNASVRNRVVERTVERFGRIDILINNAGIGLYAPAWKAPLDEAHAMFELNFFAPLAMIQLVTPHMRERRSGMIVNIGSIAGKVTLPWFTLYSATKFALGALTDGLRMELAGDGILTMVVCPGYVMTDFQMHALVGQAPDRLLKGRKFAITPEQCAEAVARGVERDARTVVTPRSGWALIALQRLFPTLVERQMRKIYRGLPQ
jgi:short-subunit dehydrogenase